MTRHQVERGNEPPAASSVRRAATYSNTGADEQAFRELTDPYRAELLAASPDYDTGRTGKRPPRRSVPFRPPAVSERVCT